MQNIDPYSYQCGVIDCFNEMVRSGVKALALSHPMDSAAERDALIPFVNRSFLMRDSVGSIWYVWEVLRRL